MHTDTRKPFAPALLSDGLLGCCTCSRLFATPLRKIESKLCEIWHLARKSSPQILQHWLRAPCGHVRARVFNSYENGSEGHICFYVAVHCQHQESRIKATRKKRSRSPHVKSHDQPTHCMKVYFAHLGTHLTRRPDRNA